MYGRYFVEYTMKNGWEEMLRCMSPNLKVKIFFLCYNIFINRQL